MQLPSKVCLFDCKTYISGTTAVQPNMFLYRMHPVTGHKYLISVVPSVTADEFIAVLLSKHLYIMFNGVVVRCGAVTTRTEPVT